MSNAAFKSLIDGLNAQIAVINQNDLKAYDPDNEGIYLAGFVYDKENDRIFLRYAEDKNFYLSR